MKTIAAPAMAAIEAGEAIVTGALEIIPRSIVQIEYTVVDTVDVDAVTNAATTDAGGLVAGITLPGFDPLDRVRVSLPTGQTHVAWSPWGVPAYSGSIHTGSLNRCYVIPDGVAANVFTIGDAQFTDGPGNHGYNGYEAARAAFGVGYFDGASAYTFFFRDNPTADNTGGLSILVERGVATLSGGGDPIRVWGGHAPLEIDGELYQPIGDRGLAQQTAGAIGGFAQGLTLSLSGIEPHVLDLLDGDEIKGASAVLRRLIFASDGKTLLDAQVFDRGRVDTVESDEVIGGTATVNVAVETAARGLGSSGARQRSDSDQRLINPNDGYFKNTAFAGEKMLYWGGKRPRTGGSALGGGSGGSSSDFVNFFAPR